MTFIDTSNASSGAKDFGLPTSENSLSASFNQDPFTQNNSGSALLSSGLRVEAEAMNLENYRIERIDFASGGAVASFAGESSNERGSASFNFAGQAGVYDIVLGYFDEEGGRAELDPRLNNQSLGSFKLEQNLGSKFATADNLVRRTVGDNISLQEGDTFSIRGIENAGEHARIDYIDFISVDNQPQSSPDTSSSNTSSGRALASSSTSDSAIRINAGGDRYTDSNGNVWQADSFFEDGWTNNRNNSIQNTPDDPLYQSERYAKTLDYSVSVANGTYSVNLLFSETYWSGAGKREFDVDIEGRSVIDNLDIHREVGKFKALNKRIENVTVTDGKLDIALESNQDYAKLSGLEIIPVNSSTGSGAEQPSSEEPLIESDRASNNNSSNNNSSSNRPLSSNATIRYISPNGNGDGSSWQQAASIRELDNLIERANPGDEIWIAGDLGTYYVGGQDITIRHGSNGSAPIQIRGVASQQGRNDTPLFVGDRAENWQPGKADGSELFRLLKGADHLSFSNLNFKNVGNGVFKFGDDVTGVTLQDMEADNVRRFVENHASGGAKVATVTDLTIKDIDVRGFSKGAIRLQYDSNNILIEDVYGDAEGQDGDNFIMGVQLTDSVHNVLHRNVTMKNAIQRGSASDYWNADGFVTEWGTYDITYENTFASGSTDGGYDLKSRNTTLLNAGAADNKRNFRIWSDATLINITSDEPNSRGGTGTQAHINILNDANVTIQDSTFSGNKDINNIIFDLDDRGRLTVNGANITDDDYVLHTVAQGNISLNNIKEP